MTYRLSREKVDDNVGLFRAIQAVALDATEPGAVKIHCDPDDISRTQYAISEALKSAELYSEEFQHLRAAVRVRADTIEKCVLIEPKAMKAKTKGPVHSLIEPHDLEDALSLLSAYGGSSTPVALTKDVDVNRFEATAAILGWELLDTAPMKTFKDGSKLLYVSRVEEDEPSDMPVDVDSIAERLAGGDDESAS